MTITKGTLHYVTCDTFQRGCIEQKVLIFYGINIKIGNDGSSTSTPLLPCPKVKHMLEDIIL